MYVSHMIENFVFFLILGVTKPGLILVYTCVQNVCLTSRGHTTQYTTLGQSQWKFHLSFIHIK